MKLYAKKMDLILVLIYSSFFFLTILEDISGKWFLIVIIIVLLRLMWLHRFNQSILIFLTFVFTYFLYMVFYFFWGIHYSTYMLDLQTMDNANGVLRVISLFCLLLFYRIKLKKRSDQPTRELLEYTHNRITFLVCLVIMSSILCYALSGNNIFDHTYGKNTTNSSLFEYYFLFAIVARCNARNKLEHALIFIVSTFYAVAILSLGLRLVFLILSMYVFIFYFEDKIKSCWVVLASVIGFVGATALQYIRVGWNSLDISSLDVFSFLGIHDNYMMNNQGDVFLTSTVHYCIVHDGFMSIGDRITSLLAFIANFFLISENQIEIGILNQYIASSYRVGGGGFGAMYAYVWLGYGGVILLAIYLAHFINAIYDKEKLSYYGIFLIITSFRWFAYSLPIVFKMGMYLFIIYRISNMISGGRGIIPAREMNNGMRLGELFCKRNH